MRGASDVRDAYDAHTARNPNMTHTSVPAALENLIAIFATPNPDDPAPAVTRATIQLLRILQASGPEEMVDAIDSSMAAGFMAFKAILPKDSDVATVMLALVAEHAKMWIEASQQHDGEEGTDAESEAIQ
jgi:hypothetical protein